MVEFFLLVFPAYSHPVPNVFPKFPMCPPKGFPNVGPPIQFTIAIILCTWIEFSHFVMMDGWMNGWMDGWFPRNHFPPRSNQCNPIIAKSWNGQMANHASLQLPFLVKGGCIVCRPTNNNKLTTTRYNVLKCGHVPLPCLLKLCHQVFQIHFPYYGSSYSLVNNHCKIWLLGNKLQTIQIFSPFPHLDFDFSLVAFSKLVLPFKAKSLLGC
jgi:hypothetical protein